MNFNETFNTIINKNNKNELKEIEEYINKFKKNKEIFYIKRILEKLSNKKLQNEKENILLTKIDDITILEYIIAVDFSIPTELGNFICTKESLLEIYLKYQKTDIFTYKNEKLFYKKINNKMILEHLLENNNLVSHIIYKINDTILIDLLKKYNKLDLIRYANDNMLFKKLDQELVIDYLFKENLLTPEIIREIRDKKIINYILHYKRYDLLKHINPNILIQKNNNKFIIDMILDMNINPEIQTFFNPKLAKLLIKRNRYELLKNAGFNILKEKVGNKTLFEVLIEKNIIPVDGINAVNYRFGEYKLFYGILLKHNKLELLKDAPEESLIDTYGTNRTLLEELLINKLKPSCKFYKHEETFRILLKCEEYKELENYADEEILFAKIDDNNLLIDEILKRNLNIKYIRISNEIIIKKIFEYKRYDLYEKISVRKLLEKNESNQTYLEIILDCFKEHNINITDFIHDITSSEEKAELYSIYASKNLELYLPRLSKEDLLEKGEPKLITILINKYPKYINKIISKRVRRDLDIAMILKLNGIEQKDIEFESFVSKLEQNYLTKIPREYSLLEITQEEEEQLNELRQLMTDDTADKRLIEVLISTYRHLFHIKSPYAYEVNRIIEAKLNNPRFSYIMEKDGALFSRIKKKVIMDDTNIDTLNHETSHALHYFFTSQDVPEDIEKEIEYLSKDEDFLKKANEYSIKFKELLKNVEEQVERLFMPKYDESITEEKIEEIKGYLEELNYIERHKYLSQGYSEETLDLICNRTFTVEEYLEQDRKIIKENMVDLILRIEFGNFTAIGDIFDGIYKGVYASGLLKTKEGEKIYPGYGHGIYYYNKDIQAIFNEMIANYGGIVKSNNPEQGIMYLKEYIGENLFNMIKKYYDEYILKNPNYVNEIGGNYGR